MRSAALGAALLWLPLAASAAETPEAAPEKQPDEQKDKPKDKPDDPEQPSTRYKTVVTASQTRSTVFESPRAAQVVTRDELRARPPRTTADALNDVEGVFIERTNYSQGSPYVRGLTGQQVVLLVDGIRLNNTTTRTGPNGLLNLIDPYTIDSIDVVRGPGSVLYGSDAVGGVIQVRTRHPTPIVNSDIDLNAGVRGIYTSYDQGGQGSLSAGGKWGRYALDAAFSLRRFGDLTGGSEAPYQPLTGYREGGLYLGGGADFSWGSLVLVYQGVRQYDALRTDRSKPGDLVALPELSRDLGYLRYKGSFSSKGLVQPLSVQATVSFHRHLEVQDRLRVLQNRLDRDNNEVDVLGVTAFGDADTGRFGRFVFGVDGTFEWVRSESNRGLISDGPGGSLTPQPEAARYPNGSTAQSVAAYLQDDVDLESLFGRSESGRRPGRIKALLGLRAGGSFLSIGPDDRLSRLFPQVGAASVIPARREDNPVYAGSVLLRYEPVSGLALSGGLLTGFRAPNLADYARLGQEGLGYSVPATNLHPEVAYSGEAGVRLAFRKVEGSAFYAYTLIDSFLQAVPVQIGGTDCLTLAPDGRTCLVRFYGRENSDRARLHAVEATGRLYIVGGLSVYAALSYTYGTIDRATAPGQQPVTEPFYKIPPLNGVAAVQLRRPRSIFHFAEFSLRWAAAQRMLGPTDLDDPRVCLPIHPPGMPCDGTPGFAVLALRGAARLSRGIFVTGAVENLTNTTYRYHGSGIDGPGLGASVSLEANY